MHSESHHVSQFIPRLRWLSIVGARPQFIKLSPVCRAIDAHNLTDKRPRIEHRIIHTGQHYDREMAELFFVQLGIPAPHCNLGVGSGSQGEQLARMLERLEPALRRESPEWVLVYGDTNSTLAGALMAARLGLSLAHVEAGCRSYTRTMPEEQNRVVADCLSQVLLAPSSNAVENLRRAGIGTPDDPLRRRVALVGDVTYDALLVNLILAERLAQETLEKLGVSWGAYYVLTVHRAENTEDLDRLFRILRTVDTLDLPVVFPVHPRTRQALSHAQIPVSMKNVRIIAPLGYLEMLAAEKHCCKILTDSGGVQKEAFYLGVPCVTLRDETEWPETVELGANRIAGTDPDRILDSIRTPQPMPRPDVRPFGDGTTSKRIVDELLLAEACGVRRRERTSQVKDAAALRDV